MSNKPGRNVSCPCGSGKKYKRCCLAVDEAAARERARQRGLWDDEWADVDSESDDDPFLDVDDAPALDVGDLVRVCYARGLVGRLSDLRSGRGMQITEWETSAIPQSVLDSIAREAVDALEGEWGDPRAGTPIQVDIIDLETENDHITIQIFNRAIGLLHADSEELRRIHRVCSALETAVRIRQPEDVTGAGAERASRSTPTPAPRTVDMAAVLKAHRRLGGTCALCGKELTRTGARQHLTACAPAHDVTSGPVKELLQLRVTSPGLPAYWLDLEVRLDAKLEALDAFLRRTWLECCGHLSAFSIGSVKYFSRGYELGVMSPFGGSGGLSERSMAARLADALPGIGGRFDYEYDFGSTTMLQVSVVEERTGRIGRSAARLLARNTAPSWPCASCGQPASMVCSFCLSQEENAFACALHAADHGCGETDGFMPVVNSPRMGVCGYGVEN